MKHLEFAATGGITFAQTVTVSAAPTVEAEVTVPIPAAAVGAVTLSVRAVDTAGNSGASAQRVVTVADRTAPAVAITSPPANAEFDPRNAIPVTVTATDNLAVTEVSLTRFDAGGAPTLVETRAVQPPVTPRTESFSITLPAPPPAASTLRLRAASRDAAGNAGASTDVTIRLADVVAPSVSSTTPATGATGVDVTSTVSVAFSEPMDPVTLTSTTVVLRAGATPVATTFAVGGGNLSVLLTPQVSLAVNTLYTVSVTGLRDAAGNALPDTTITFRTVSPDNTAPKVSSIDPANNAIGVGGSAPVTVVFTEAVDTATVTGASFRVSVDGATIAGSYSFLDGNTRARFTPATPYGLEKTVLVELTGAIKDTANNALVNADGTPITTPITSTFLTGNFVLTSPAGTSVVERSTITIEAQASASLAPASVVFSVNGTALPADTAAPFSVSFTVPPAATTKTLVIVASARNGSNTEIARAEKTVTVVPGLEITPTLLGVPRGATRPLTLSIAEPVDADLAIAVSSGNPAVATVAPANVTILAGQKTVDVNVTGCPRARSRTRRAETRPSATRRSSRRRHADRPRPWCRSAIPCRAVASPHSPRRAWRSRRRRRSGSSCCRRAGRSRPSCRC